MAYTSIKMPKSQVVNILSFKEEGDRKLANKNKFDEYVTHFVAVYNIHTDTDSYRTDQWGEVITLQSQSLQ